MKKVVLGLLLSLGLLFSCGSEPEVINGKDGKSIFELWKEQPGNENKTITDFFNFLKGGKGEEIKKLLGVWDKVEEYIIFKGVKTEIDINQELEKDGYYSEYKMLEFRNDIALLTKISHQQSGSQRTYTSVYVWRLLDDSIFLKDLVYKYEIKDEIYLKILKWMDYKDGEIEYKYVVFKKRK